MRALLVTCFLITLSGWIWVVAATRNTSGSDSVGSIALDEQHADLGGLELQVKVGRAFRDVALERRRDLMIIQWVLLADTLVILAVIIRREVWQEGMEKSAP
jgi:hypothetical protein